MLTYQSNSQLQIEFVYWFTDSDPAQIVRIGSENVVDTPTFFHVFAGSQVLTILNNTYA